MGIDDFILNSKNEVFDNLDRSDAGLITQKQIRYVYVLARENNIPKEELDALEFRGMSSDEASELIESLQNGTFYNDYCSEDTSLEALMADIDEDDLPFF